MNVLRTTRAPRVWLFAAIILLSRPAAAALPQPVSEALAAAGISETAVGLYVQEVTANRPVMMHGAERALNPASTMKLVTTYAALELLGPAYTWNTEVYVAGNVRDETLHGDLVIKGYGDPKLTLENFWLLLRAVRARGVREIRGDVILDRTFFSTGDYDPARFDDQPLRPYNTGPDALLVNFKAVNIQLVPDAEGTRVRLITEPPLAAVQIVNSVALDDASCGDWASRLKFDAQPGGDTARLVVSGSYARECGERSRSFSLLSHKAYTGELFSEIWKELGGTVSGTIRDGQLPAGARLLFSAPSPQLSEIVRDINKFSNNVMARQLFLTLGALSAGAPGTLDKGRSAVRQWVAQRGAAMPELVLDNGSGLSRNERISARSMGEMLVAAYRSPVMPEFIASMPLVAV